MLLAELINYAPSANVLVEFAVGASCLSQIVASLPSVHLLQTFVTFLELHAGFVPSSWRRRAC